MIYTNWDPLIEVIVGDCYTAHHKNKLDQIFAETKEDLDNLADYLSKLGVSISGIRQYNISNIYQYARSLFR